MELSINIALTAIVLLSLLSPARAAPATAEKCRTLLASVPLAQDQPTTVEPIGTDGCRFTGVRFAFGPYFGYQVGSLVERGIPFGRLAVPDKRVDVRVEAQDIVFALHSGNAKTDWLNRQQQVPFDVVVDGRYDPDKREIVLRDLSMDGRAIGHTSLAAVVINTDRGRFAQSAGVRSLKLRIDSRRFIVAFLLAPLLPALPDEDPGTAMTRARSLVASMARTALTQGGTPPKTIAAIAGFIDDFPHPQHVFDLSITSSAPVTIDALARAAAGPADLAALLRTLALTASYAGEPH